MKSKKLILFLLIFTQVKVIAARPLYQTFDRQQFYGIIKSGSAESIDNELALLSDGTIIERNAYIGTLLMKKASLVSLPKDKLNLFKEGRIKLETAMKSDSSNAEYHFLRLIIEEHAPKIVKYKSQLAADARYVEQHFRKLPVVVQRAVLDYSKTSTILRPENIKYPEE